jgi:hypothetical protein
MRFGEIRIERHGPADQQRGIGAPQLMGDHSQQMERTRIFRIGVAGKPVEALGLGQTPGTVMGPRSGERLLGPARGVHRDISV